MICTVLTNRASYDVPLSISACLSVSLYHLYMLKIHNLMTLKTRFIVLISSVCIVFLLILTT